MVVDFFATVGLQSCFSSFRNSAKTAVGFSARAACATNYRYLPPSSPRVCAPPASPCYSNSTLQHRHERTFLARKGIDL